MKKLFLVLATLLVFFSCTKETTEIYIIENVTVKFHTKSVLSVETEGLRSTASEIDIPVNFKAYFVAAESKGQYTSGQLITTLDVSSGVHTITVPKIKYDVYVTNYEQEGDWYTWDDALEQLPKSSYDLYLYGKNQIDYSINLIGEVIVENPYSALFIHVDYLDPARTPKEYNGSKDYIKFDDEWWYIFTRKDHNSHVWIKQSIGNKAYQWSSELDANKIYRFRFNNDPGTTDLEGNFNVIVEPWGEESEEVISVV